MLYGWGDPGLQHRIRFGHLVVAIEDGEKALQGLFQTRRVVLKET